MTKHIEWKSYRKNSGFRYSKKKLQKYNSVVKYCEIYIKHPNKREKSSCKKKRPTTFKTNSKHSTSKSRRG